MTTRTKLVATYYFPGSLFPEECTREIHTPARTEAEAAIWGAVGEGLGNCYGIRIDEVTERLWRSDDREEWRDESCQEVDSWIYGEKIHYTDRRISDEKYEILRDNIRINTDDGYGVRTIVGNWQFASDWNRVVSGPLG